MRARSRRRQYKMRGASIRAYFAWFQLAKRRRQAAGTRGMQAGRSSGMRGSRAKSRRMLSAQHTRRRRRWQHPREERRARCHDATSRRYDVDNHATSRMAEEAGVMARGSRHVVTECADPASRARYQSILPLRDDNQRSNGSGRCRYRNSAAYQDKICYARTQSEARRGQSRHMGGIGASNMLLRLRDAGACGKMAARCAWRIHASSRRAIRRHCLRRDCCASDPVRKVSLRAYWVKKSMAREMMRKMSAEFVYGTVELRRTQQRRRVERRASQRWQRKWSYGAEEAMTARRQRGAVRRRYEAAGETSVQWTGHRSARSYVWRGVVSGVYNNNNTTIIIISIIINK